MKNMRKSTMKIGQLRSVRSSNSKLPPMIYMLLEHVCAHNSFSRTMWRVLYADGKGAIGLEMEGLVESDKLIA